MHLRDFKTGWRLLISQPAYSTVIVLGLSIGFAVLAYAKFSFSYDDDVPQCEHIYQVIARSSTLPDPTRFDGVPYPPIDVARKSDLVEVETALSPKTFTLKVNTQDRLQEDSPHGDRELVIGLTIVGLMILSLAVTNFVNLTTVRAIARRREIAIRKILGASVVRLIAHFTIRVAPAKILQEP